MSIDGSDYVSPDFTSGPPRLIVSGFKNFASSANGTYTLSNKISNCSPVYHKAGEYKTFGFDTANDFSNFENRYFFNNSNEFFGLSNELIKINGQELNLKFNPVTSSYFFGLFSDSGLYQNRDTRYINFENCSISILLNITPSEGSTEYEVGLSIRQFDNYYTSLFDTVRFSNEENLLITKTFNDLIIENIFSNYENNDPMKGLDLIKDGSCISEVGFFIKPKVETEDSIDIKLASVFISNSFCDDYYISEFNDKIVLSKSLSEPTASSFIASNMAFRQKFNPASDGHLLSSDNLDFFYSGRPHQYELDYKLGCSADFYGDSAKILPSFGDKTNIESKSFNWDIDMDENLDGDADPLGIVGLTEVRSFKFFDNLIPEEYTSFDLNIEGIHFHAAENDLNKSLTTLCFEINRLYRKTGVWAFFAGIEFFLVRPMGGPPPAALLVCSNTPDHPEISVAQSASDLSFSPNFYSNIRYVF